MFSRRANDAQVEVAKELKLIVNSMLEFDENAKLVNKKGVATTIPNNKKQFSSNFTWWEDVTAGKDGPVRSVRTTVACTIHTQYKGDDFKYGRGSRLLEVLKKSRALIHESKEGIMHGMVPLGWISGLHTAITHNHDIEKILKKTVPLDRIFEDPR